MRRSEGEQPLTNKDLERAVDIVRRFTAYVDEDEVEAFGIVVARLQAEGNDPLNPESTSWWQRRKGVRTLAIAVTNTPRELTPGEQQELHSSSSIKDWELKKGSETAVSHTGWQLFVPDSVTAPQDIQRTKLPFYTERPYFERPQYHFLHVNSYGTLVSGPKYNTYINFGKTYGEDATPQLVANIWDINGGEKIIRQSWILRPEASMLGDYYATVIGIKNSTNERHHIYDLRLPVENNQTKLEVAVLTQQPVNCS